ncbi:zf-HC2 domain-containing protein [Leucobacter chromiireducens]|uniref:Alpha-ketoglutarate decarboxylase n=1 Tax=Leucobacter chromiireducens subsp. solipictus TaxID=398235 RepID=A0ABS1SCI1_9MICO|nr:zf-HC2 domain-containing protein [Leucobacter chromiireducens]MBL3678081.1 alpha-ketoglutarate decarboxylase [Leucobacter chromiireducens subsp. solipictus]
MSDCDCETAQKNLYEVLRGELCAEESAPIREHIEQCPGCQNEQSVCERLTEVVRRTCEDERADSAPVDLRDAILNNLRAG